MVKARLPVTTRRPGGGDSAGPDGVDHAVEQRQPDQERFQEGSRLRAPAKLAEPDTHDKEERRAKTSEGLNRPGGKLAG